MFEEKIGNFSINCFLFEKRFFHLLSLVWVKKVSFDFLMHFLSISLLWPSFTKTGCDYHWNTISDVFLEKYWENILYAFSTNIYAIFVLSMALQEHTFHDANSIRFTNFQSVRSRVRVVLVTFLTQLISWSFSGFSVFAHTYTNVILFVITNTWSELMLQATFNYLWAFL